MSRVLEDILLQNILKGDQNAVQMNLSKGANPNKITSQGKTCLGEASKIGNFSIVKLLLDSIDEDINAIAKKVPRKKYFRSQKRKLKCMDGDEESISKCKNLNDRSYSGNRITDKNNGYFVLINSDGSSSDDSKFGNMKSPSSSSTPTTPSADLEWDDDIITVAPITSEDETWSSIYKWYAAILENTGAAIAAASKVTYGVNQQDAYMRTALHYAAEQGHTEVIKLLVHAGSKLDISAGDGLTPLHLSVIKNNIESVKLLLSAGCHINYKTHEKMTALHFAASRGYLELVKILVDSGADIEARDTSERTALYLAAGRGHINVIKFLISVGANINGEEIHGYTPLCEAVWQRYSAIVELLLKSGARVTHSHKLLHNAIIQRNEDIVKMLINHGGGINLHNDTGDTPLLLAIRFSQINIVKALLEKNANINICNNITGANALHIAVENIECPAQFEEVLTCLLERNIHLNTTALTGDTPLNRALLLQKDYSAISLIRHGADVNTFDLQSCGLDNLSIVKRRSSNKLASILLKAGHVRPIHAQCCKTSMKETTSYWIHRVCKEPYSLLDICRITIRNLSKGRPIHRFVHLLPLPQSLKSFLMFEDEYNNVI